MFDPWRHFLDAITLGIGAQGAIALRSLRLFAGGPAALGESHLMITEKVAALMAAGTAAVTAFASGSTLDVVAEHGLAPVRLCVAGNLRRLSQPAE